MSAGSEPMSEGFHRIPISSLPILTMAFYLEDKLQASSSLNFVFSSCGSENGWTIDQLLSHQVADFGLSKLLDSGQTHQSTRVRGTYGEPAHAVTNPFA